MRGALKSNDEKTTKGRRETESRREREMERTLKVSYCRDHTNLLCCVVTVRYVLKA